MEAKYLPTDAEIEAIAKLSASTYFTDINNRLGEIYTSPEKREEADKIASVDEFVRLGGKTEPGFRLSLREFEQPISPTRKLDYVDYDLLEKVDFKRPIDGVNVVDNVSKAATKGTLCASVGYIICCSYGREVDFKVASDFDSGFKFDAQKYQEGKAILLYLREFASDDRFQKLLSQLYALPAEQRNAFVKSSIINTESLAKSGLSVPKDIIIQRSAFSDNRPTLFCLTKYRADGKTKLTITFDSAM